MGTFATCYTAAPILLPRGKNRRLNIHKGTVQKAVLPPLTLKVYNIDKLCPDVPRSPVKQSIYMSEHHDAEAGWATLWARHQTLQLISTSFY